MRARLRIGFGHKQAEIRDALWGTFSHRDDGRVVASCCNTAGLYDVDTNTRVISFVDDAPRYASLQPQAGPFFHNV